MPVPATRRFGLGALASIETVAFLGIDLTENMRAQGVKSWHGHDGWKKVLGGGAGRQDGDLGFDLLL